MTTTNDTELISDAFIFKLIISLIILFGLLAVIYGAIKKRLINIAFINRHLPEHDEQEINVIARQKISQNTTVYVIEFKEQSYLLAESQKDAVATFSSPIIKSISQIEKEN